MTIISFVLFIVIYLLAALGTVEPYYFKNMIFAVPLICFGIITFFTAKGKLKIAVSSIITVILIITLFFLMSFSFTFLIFKTATTVTTDTGKYKRVLKVTDYPNSSLTKHFPDKIPDNAKNIVFRYNPAFLQGGENFELKFETDSYSIKNYINKFSKNAKWIGKSNDSKAEENGIFSGIFGNLGLGYGNLPEDYTIYLIDSKPYRPGDWNHGKLSLAAISKQKNEIIFYAENW